MQTLCWRPLFRVRVMEMHTFTFLQLQSRPSVVKIVVPPFCTPGCRFLSSVWNEMSLYATEALWQQHSRVMKQASDTWLDISPWQMTLGAPEVLCNLSFIRRYQIIVDNTSVTLVKPVLWAINMSPVTLLYISHLEMRGLKQKQNKNQLAFGKSWSIGTSSHILYFWVSINC